MTLLSQRRRRRWKLKEQLYGNYDSDYNNDGRDNNDDVDDHVFMSTVVSFGAPVILDPAAFQINICPSPNIK